MSTLPTISLYAAATTTALIAGLFYAYACSVNPGLNRLSDVAYLSAMQSINRAILNPVFFLSFMGTVLLLPLSTWLQYSQPGTLRFWLLVAASLVYIIGVFGVTAACNVPLNEALNAFNIETASAEEISAQRATFETTWNNWNTIRTVANIVALLLVLGACLSPKTD